MSLKGAYPKRTICEVPREINDLAQGDNEHDLTIRRKLALCELMAKKMQRKLTANSKQWDADWWKANPDYAAKLEKRSNERYCVEEPEKW